MNWFRRLWMRLVSPRRSIHPWRDRLDAIRELKNELRYRDAAEQLSDLLIDLGTASDPAAAELQAVTLGELGECYFQLGEADRALIPTQQALDLVTRTGDRDGVIAYLGNLYEIHRYLGQPAQAADRLDTLVAVLDAQGQSTPAARYRRQAALVRAGEPLNRVVVAIHGQRYEVEEVLQGIEGGVQFFFERNRPTLYPCEALLQQAEQVAAQGHYETALALFREAAAADPFAPHPHLESAVTLMHLERLPEAIEEYARTEELAPGWFHARSESWLAEQILLGHQPHQAFLLLRAIEDAGLPPEAILRLARQGLDLAPDLPHFHYHLGRALRAQPPDAITAYRRGLTVADEPDIRSRLLVELAGILGPGPEQRPLLEEALALPGNLVAQATARLLLAFGQSQATVPP